MRFAGARRMFDAPVAGCDQSSASQRKNQLLQTDHGSSSRRPMGLDKCIFLSAGRYIAHSVFLSNLRKSTPNSNFGELRHALSAAHFHRGSIGSRCFGRPFATEDLHHDRKGSVVDRQSTATSFLVIPYASPPVGKLRWSAPRPVSPWVEPRDASRIGNVCPQVVLALFAVPGLNPGDVQGEEDCMYLNVYTPAKARPDSRLPVVVWIHGGAFTVGSGSAHDGSVLAANYGLVVVTMNYRLGALGFLALVGLDTEGKGDRSGNYGLLDQQAALQWVKNNIGAFGGNDQNVTIAGESAGGMSVCAQLAFLRAAGFFQRAIIQSGLCESPGNAVTVGEAERRNVEYVQKLGCSATDIDCLRHVEPAKLMSTKVPGRRPVSNLVWSPVYESAVLPLKLQTAFSQGKFNRVPVLNETNHDEGRLFVSVASPNGKPVIAVQYWGGTGLLVGAANTRKVLLQYPFRTYGKPALASATMFTDGAFSCPAERIDSALSKYVPV